MGLCLSLSRMEEGKGSRESNLSTDGIQIRWR